MDHTGCSRIEIISSSKDASRKNRKVAQANTARNTAEGVLNWCVIGFAGLTSNYFEVQDSFCEGDRDTCEALGEAFETAWQRLLVSGSALASSRYADATREALAMHIIDLAQRGERNLIRLQDDAVAFVRGALEGQ
jgi:hypothetical protein